MNRRFKRFHRESKYSDVEFCYRKNTVHSFLSSTRHKRPYHRCLRRRIVHRKYPKIKIYRMFKHL